MSIMHELSYMSDLNNQYINLNLKFTLKKIKILSSKFNKSVKVNFNNMMRIEIQKCSYIYIF